MSSVSKAKANTLKVTALALLIAIPIGCAYRYGSQAVDSRSSKFKNVFSRGISKADLAKAFGTRFVPGQAPLIESKYNIEYSLDQRLQLAVEQSLKRGGIPYGAFVALDAKTGQVLAMASHGVKGENLALRATFPAASIFKIVTAAAAIETGVLSHNSMIPVRGSYHTLYKQNIFKGGGIAPQERSRFLRLISFEDALAKSVNSVFGKVGIFGTGAVGLRKAASSFMFGQSLPFELPVDASAAKIPDDEFGLAESASGFTRQTTLSPLHGAMIAASVINGGTVMEPTIISKLTAIDGSVEYISEPTPMATVINPQTADQLAKMMHKTITSGTSRRSFRRINRVLNDVYIGGKTGSLDGWDPKGRYDWFVGFGERGDRRIAIAALCIHGDRRGVKSSMIARDALETYFGPVVAEHPAPKAKRTKI